MGFHVEGKHQSFEPSQAVKNVKIDMSSQHSLYVFNRKD